MRLLLVLLLAGCDPGTAMVDGGTDAWPGEVDSDGDGIDDEEEGRGEARDTDGDGTPDFLDLDSDDDGLPDAYEGADDSDLDRAPNYVDADSDNNGILDGDEPDRDWDGDGYGVAAGSSAVSVRFGEVEAHRGPAALQLVAELGVAPRDLADEESHVAADRAVERKRRLVPSHRVEPFRPASRTRPLSGPSSDRPRPVAARSAGQPRSPAAGRVAEGDG